MEINIWIVLGILYIHWVADFVCQTDFEAQNKSKSNVALLQHVSKYSILWLIAICYYKILNKNVSDIILLFPVITFICHFVTDYFTSRLNTKLWNSKKVHEFFVSIGFDQLLHFIQLILTFYLLSLY